MTSKSAARRIWMTVALQDFDPVARLLRLRRAGRQRAGRENVCQVYPPWNSRSSAPAEATPPGCRGTLAGRHVSRKWVLLNSHLTGTQKRRTRVGGNRCSCCTAHSHCCRTIQRPNKGPGGAHG